jgi:hypothetical protein
LQGGEGFIGGMCTHILETGWEHVPLSYTVISSPRAAENPRLEAFDGFRTSIKLLL